MKAIHNCYLFFQNYYSTVFNTSKIQNESNSQPKNKTPTTVITVFNTSKIQNESNSQLCANFDVINTDCVQYIKNTK